MRRKAAIVVALVGLVLAAAIGAAGTSAAPERATATNLTIWVGWSARELNEFKKVVAEYDAKNATSASRWSARSTTTRSPPRSARGTCPTSSARSRRRTSASTARRAAGSTSRRYLKRDKISPTLFPATTRYYTQYAGTRCALPLLADAYGFYYNKAALQEGGAQPAAAHARGADHLREEADHAEGGRVARRRRVRPVHRLLPELDRRLPAARRGEVLRLGGQVVALEGPGLAAACSAGRRTSSTTTATTSSSSGRRGPATSGPRRTRSGAGSSR